MINLTTVKVTASDYSEWRRVRGQRFSEKEYVQHIVRKDCSEFNQNMGKYKTERLVRCHFRLIWWAKTFKSRNIKYWKGASRGHTDLMNQLWSWTSTSPPANTTGHSPPLMKANYIRAHAQETWHSTACYNKELYTKQRYLYEQKPCSISKEILHSTENV